MHLAPEIEIDVTRMLHRGSPGSPYKNPFPSHRSALLLPADLPQSAAVVRGKGPQWGTSPLVHTTTTQSIGLLGYSITLVFLLNYIEDCYKWRLMVEVDGSECCCGGVVIW